MAWSMAMELSGMGSSTRTGRSHGRGEGSCLGYRNGRYAAYTLAPGGYVSGRDAG